MPEQIWPESSDNVVKSWRIDIPSNEFHLSFIHSSATLIFGLAGTLTLHRGMLYLFLAPNHDNLLAYYFIQENSWKMMPISLENQKIIPFECEGLAIMCSRERYVQMTLIND